MQGQRRSQLRLLRASGPHSLWASQHFLIPRLLKLPPHASLFPSSADDEAAGALLLPLQQLRAALHGAAAPALGDDDGGDASESSSSDDAPPRGAKRRRSAASSDTSDGDATWADTEMARALPPPDTKSPSGKRFTQPQRDVLEAQYSQNRYPDSADVQRLATQLTLAPTRVRT